MGQIITQHKGGMLFETEMGKHKLVIEGPESWGGKDRGPMPPQIFMASIGSCVGVLVAHFCDTHGLDDTGLQVTVEYYNAEHTNPVNKINFKIKLDKPK